MYLMLGKMDAVQGEMTATSTIYQSYVRSYH